MCKCVWIIEAYNKENKEWEPMVIGGVYRNRKSARIYCNEWRNNNSMFNINIKYRIKKYIQEDCIPIKTEKPQTNFSGLSNNSITF